FRHGAELLASRLPCSGVQAMPSTHRFLIGAYIRGRGPLLQRRPSAPAGAAPGRELSSHPNPSSPMEEATMPCASRCAPGSASFDGCLFSRLAAARQALDQISTRGYTVLTLRPPCGSIPCFVVLEEFHA